MIDLFFEFLMFGGFIDYDDEENLKEQEDGAYDTGDNPNMRV